MEVIRGWTHRAFACEEASGTGQARRHCAELARAFGWDDVQAGRLAIVATELGANLARHARQGRLLVAARPHDRSVEIVSIDEGPGIADLAQSLRDGFSTGGTPGTGLGAVRRLANEFDIHSSCPDGTVCVVRVGPDPAQPGTRSRPGELQFGAVCLPAPGETECGDGWSLVMQGERARVLVADGLGHGPEAAKASGAACATFESSPWEPLANQMALIHAELKTTRGAAVCLAELDGQADSLRYTGAGNIVGRMLSGICDKSLLTQHGTAGLQIRRPEETTAEWAQHGLIVLHSDGIETRWDGAKLLPLLGRDPTLVAALLVRQHSRHRDDATVVVLRRRDE